MIPAAFTPRSNDEPSTPIKKTPVLPSDLTKENRGTPKNLGPKFDAVATETPAAA